MKKSVLVLIKDIALALIAWGICTAIFNAFMGHTTGVGGAMAMALFCAGIPFGWRWSSKIITAVSIKGILIKLVMSIFLGWFAIFVVLGKDIIKVIAESVQSKNTGSDL